ncbi:hypothetical protein [Sulfurimonas sp.]|nr:hypothetical protein [Sulfurimonas sp.]
MINLVMSIETFFVDSKEHRFGNGGVRIEYVIYSNNTTIATINTGVYAHGQDRKESTYYIKMVFAGLKSYDDYNDELRSNFLFAMASWLNSKRLPFKLSELDCNIDVNCAYDNFYAMQIKKVPNGRYHNEQIYITTNYLQKKTKSVSALFYDKQFKESLHEQISRFELKLPSKFFKNKNLDTLNEAISRIFERYAIFYFEDIRVKNQVLYIQKCIECSNIANKAREYNKLMSQVNKYRLYPNFSYIMEYIYNLYSIKNYKMVVKKKEEEFVLNDSCGNFDF